jgi:hypothetical protein
LGPAACTAGRQKRLRDDDIRQHAALRPSEHVVLGLARRRQQLGECVDNEPGSPTVRRPARVFGGPDMQRAPRLFPVVVWRDQAEHATTSLRRGSRDVVVGRLTQRSWIAEDGSARSVVELVAEEVGPSLRWATATTTRATRSQSQ